MLRVLATRRVIDTTTESPTMHTFWLPGLCHKPEKQGMPGCRIMLLCTVPQCSLKDPGPKSTRTAQHTYALCCKVGDMCDTHHMHAKQANIGRHCGKASIQVMPEQNSCQLASCKPSPLLCSSVQCTDLHRPTPRINSCLSAVLHFGQRARRSATEPTIK